MKTIAVFHPSNEFYGADRILVNALQSFSAKKRKVVYLPKEGPLTEYIKKNVENVTIIIQPKMPIIYRALFSPKGIFQFVRNYRIFEQWFENQHDKYRFDLAYVNTLSCSFLLRILHKMKIKNFVHVHEILERPKLIAWTTTKLAEKYSDYVVCVSNAVQNNLIRILPEIKGKSHLLHNGIIEVPVGKKKADKYLTFYLFGRIMPKKGQWYLIDALSRIPKKNLKKARFVIVGGTPPGKEHLAKDLANLIKEAKLEDVVTLKGFCNDISAEMAQADVCVVPSLMKDPFPTTVLEAMSAEKPVIATNHGGAAEVIVNGENGYLISPDSAIEFAQVIERMINAKTKVAEMGKKAGEVFHQFFTLETFKANWWELHNEIQ